MLLYFFGFRASINFQLRKSHSSYPSNMEVPQENLGSPTFFHAAAVCPFFSRT